MSIVATLLVIAAPAQATPATPPAKERKICQKYAVTGSRMPSKRICKTEAEWKEYYQEVDAGSRNRDSGTAPLVGGQLPR